jgi:hypothetical protein
MEPARAAAAGAGVRYGRGEIAELAAASDDAAGGDIAA